MVIKILNMVTINIAKLIFEEIVETYWKQFKKVQIVIRICNLRKEINLSKSLKCMIITNANNAL